MSTIRELQVSARSLGSARAVTLALALGASGLAGMAIAPQADAGSTSATQTYVVLYRSGASTTSASSAIGSAGGSVVANYQQIGVVIPRSDQTAFATNVQKTSGVEAVSATSGFGVQVKGEAADSVTADTPAPGSDGEPLSGLQWDMEQIHAFAAHKISGGDPDVIVGDLDTGLDFTHPDLAPNYRADLSADCSSGVASPLLAGNDDGFFFPEMVICSYMWVAAHGIDVTNNSYFADPWLFNCRNDAEQRSIWKAERRAIRQAQSTGTVVVASEGNDLRPVPSRVDSSAPIPARQRAGRARSPTPAPSCRWRCRVSSA